MTATYVPDRWNHFLHLTPYRRGNSPAGIAIAADRPGRPSRRAIDLDFHMSRDGFFLNTHWASPEVEGFRYTVGRKAGRVCRTPFRLLSARTALSLVTTDGYRIQTAGSALWLAAQARVRVEVEMKATPSRRALRRLAATAERYYGPDWQEWVQVKMLARFWWRTTLRRAKAAGFTTFLIGFGAGDPTTLPAYVDHYRR